MQGRQIELIWLRLPPSGAGPLLADFDKGFISYLGLEISRKKIYEWVYYVFQLE